MVALGKLKIHLGEELGALDMAEIAKLMLQSDAPYVRHHAMWYLALLRSVKEIPWVHTSGFAPRESKSDLTSFPFPT